MKIIGSGTAPRRRRSFRSRMGDGYGSRGYGDRTSMRMGPGRTVRRARRDAARDHGGAPVAARSAGVRLCGPAGAGGEPRRVAAARRISASTSSTSVSSSSRPRFSWPALFFRLGVEQRAREVGLLRAVGFATSRVRRLFAAEGLAAGAHRQRDRHRRRHRVRRGDDGGPSHLVVGRRRHDRADASTSSPSSLVAGARGCRRWPPFVCIWWTLRRIFRRSPSAACSQATCVTTTRAAFERTRSTMWLGAGMIATVAAAGLLARQA